MKWTGLNQLREMYLSFFESKQHLRLPSFSLIPVEDKSLLLINSGMAPMKKWFLGQETPPSHRVTTCQKCIRTPDIESVGITARHLTYFEMLGNFSFQNYFKTEAIEWAWEFFTSPNWLAIPAEKLFITVYQDDDQTYDIWTKEIGVEESHMARLGKEDNFWEHGAGPCGPCSEIHFDRGPEYGCDKPGCTVGCDCDRYMEVWNLVFTEFNSDGEGHYEKLAKPNIDTGMGLERLACVLQGVDNVFETDTINSILHQVEKLSGKTYGKDKLTDISIRVITDHIRSTTFMVSDGVLPSNEGRGYVLRRLLRRAARHGRMLGIRDPFLAQLCENVIELNKTAYPELLTNASFIKKNIAAEEERFSHTIDQGLARLNTLIDNISKNAVADKEKILSGFEAFRLNDTYGFPLDLTREIAEEAGIRVDIEAFQKELQKQREKARQDRLARDISGWEADLFADISAPATEFTGYDTMVGEAKVVALSDGQALADALSTDEEEKEGVLVVLDKTPFYAEGGGQVADTGTLSGNGAHLRVRLVKKTAKGFYVHNCVLEKGVIKQGDTLLAEVDQQRRESIMRNHTAAHLLQRALREVLGEHVHQAGSYVDDERVRFDFTHFSAPTVQELEKVQQFVNRMIFSSAEVHAEIMPLEKAKTLGAVALFGEKYGNEVRVVDVKGWSVEFCGGTHVSNTSQIGCFTILSESSVAAGVRRIEGTTGYGVLRQLQEKEALIRQTANAMKVTNPAEIAARAASLIADNKELERELSSMKDAAAAAQADSLFQHAIDVEGVQVITLLINQATPDALRKMCDRVREKLPNSVAAICGENDGKITLAVCCGKDAITRGLKAGELVKEIAAVAGGSGGGKPDFAMAGIRDSSKVDAALAAVSEIVKGKL